MQLHLAHGALQAQQHPVVDIGGVVDAVAVDQQGVGDPGKLDQPAHIGIAARQPGDLDPEDRAGLAAADQGDQVPESLPRDTEAARDPQVGVDDLHVARCPAEPGRLAGQPVLARRGLGVLADLRH